MAHDDEEFCDCEDCQEGYGPTPIPVSYLTWQSFVGVTLSGVEGCLDAISGVVGNFSQMFLGAHNRLVELNDVHAQMTMELESLVSGEEE